jgi:hypothetical protein
MLEQYQVTRDPQKSMVEFVHSKFKDTSSCNTLWHINTLWHKNILTLKTNFLYIYTSENTLQKGQLK